MAVYCSWILLASLPFKLFSLFSESGLSFGIGCLWSVFRGSSQKIGSSSPGIYFAFALMRRYWFLFPFCCPNYFQLQTIRFWGTRKVKNLVWNPVKRALVQKTMMSRCLMWRWLCNLAIHIHTKKNMNAYVIMLNDLKSVICIQGSSNGSGEPSNAMSDEGIVSEPFQLVGILLVSLGFIKCPAWIIASFDCVI